MPRQLRTLRSFVRSAKNRLLPMRTVRIGGFEIETTPNHPLGRYLARYPLYDQFIPSLCKALSGTVIDIGANIGDTMAAILNSNPDLNVICVEPDEHFYSILERNRTAVDRFGRVKTLKAFVNNSSDHFRIGKNAAGSTGHIETTDPRNSNSRRLTFSELLSAAETASPALVKIDTDGFDAQILASIADHLELNQECTPILFFEMQTYLNNRGFMDSGRKERHKMYLHAMERLLSLGYGPIAVLDNFGTPLAINSDLAFLDHIQNYIERSQMKNAVASIHFLDVVLYQTRHMDLVNTAFRLLVKED